MTLLDQHILNSRKDDYQWAEWLKGRIQEYSKWYFEYLNTNEELSKTCRNIALYLARELKEINDKPCREDTKDKGTLTWS